jgi:hypothetical protein
MIAHFKFEEDFVESDIRCIPMIARFKLDACGIKLKLQEWGRMNEEERIHVSTYPCNTEEEIRVYRQFLKAVILYRTGNMAQEIEIDSNPEWANTNKIPEMVKQKSTEIGFFMELKQWQRLNALQRFVLVKLSRPGHENKNFPIAVHEFGLV